MSSECLQAVVLPGGFVRFNKFLTLVLGKILKGNCGPSCLKSMIFADVNSQFLLVVVLHFGTCSVHIFYTSVVVVVCIFVPHLLTIVWWHIRNPNCGNFYFFK